MSSLSFSATPNLCQLRRRNIFPLVYTSRPIPIHVEPTATDMKAFHVTVTSVLLPSSNSSKSKNCSLNFGMPQIILTTYFHLHLHEITSAIHGDRGFMNIGSWSTWWINAILRAMWGALKLLNDVSHQLHCEKLPPYCCNQQHKNSRNGEDKAMIDCERSPSRLWDWPCE